MRQSSNNKLEVWDNGNSSIRGQNNNTNNTMLSFNDDYESVLSNLANGSSQTGGSRLESSQSQSTVEVSEAEGGEGGVLVYQEGSCVSGKSLDEKQKLELLLQQYQDLPGKDGVNGAHSSVSQRASDVNKGMMSSTKQAEQEHKSAIASKPCDHCRRRRTKCVIVPGMANCVQCETKGIKCGFSELITPKMPNDMNQEGQKKRSTGDEANTNVHELLKRAKLNDMMNQDNISQFYTDLLQNLNTNASDMPGMAQTNQNHFDFPLSSVGQGSHMSNVSRGQAVQISNTTSSSRVPRQQSNQSTIQYPRSSFYVGPTSVFDINLVNHMKLDNIDQIQLSKSVSLRKVAPDVQFILRADFNQQLYLKHEREIDLVERLVHPHGKILVDIFFKLVHPYFPILHERVFLEKYSKSYRELTAPILASIYSLALQWWDFHPQVIGFPKPDVIDQLNEIALRTFFDVLGKPKLSIVQTGLLILQCRSECPNNWVLCSEVVAIAEDLGLGIDCQDWRLPRWERGLRRRLAWAVWYQDKWLSMIESRYSHLILGRNWLVKMLTEDDFPSKSPVISSSQPKNNLKNDNSSASQIDKISVLDLSPTEDDFNNGKLLFRQMISLSIILGELLDTFYTLGAISTITQIEQVLRLAKPLQLKLREWYHSLPSKLSMNNFQPRRFNSNASLTLAYFAAEITLHRKIITTLKPEDPTDLVKVCRTAAKTRLIAAIEFVRDLKMEHTSSFWYSCSTGNLTLISTFAGLLYVTARSKEEETIFRDCTRNYFWILKMASKTFEGARNALEKIQMLLSQIPGLLTDEALGKQFVPPSSQSPYVQQQFQHSNSLPSNSNTQSPHVEPNSTPTSYNRPKKLPTEVLHTLKSIQHNMPNISGDYRYTSPDNVDLSVSSTVERSLNDRASRASSNPNTNSRSPENGIPMHVAEFSSQKSSSAVDPTLSANKVTNSLDHNIDIRNHSVMSAPSSFQSDSSARKSLDSKNTPDGSNSVTQVPSIEAKGIDESDRISDTSLKSNKIERRESKPEEDAERNTSIPNTKIAK
ncbi:Dal81p Ecym_3395 [Eremothecium cymbalariae DBVPG|uniref:Zn(2)-C6 fungal-type domain-containing protein n=1 Tax=Eremothecium cymbalariae (strain CBS 270.75 / DBVPG 7215 / KCTC 17166 / NRRL Y-17582) TaxID=931890 RepID=G8JRW3_ERECY|nr:Hypothetical protein Ecym_3395 [Eremothecium cymbalariae DBVPG\